MTMNLVDGTRLHRRDDLDEDEEERIARAEKVEVGIDYIIYLEERVKELEQRVRRGH